MCNTDSSQDKGVLLGGSLWVQFTCGHDLSWALDYHIKEEWESRDFHWMDVTGKIPSTITTNMAEINLREAKVSPWMFQVMKEILKFTSVYLASVRDSHEEDLERCVDITEERIKRSTLSALKFWLILVLFQVYLSFFLSTPQFSDTLSYEIDYN